MAKKTKGEIETREKGENQGGNDGEYVRDAVKHAGVHAIISSVPRKPNRRKTTMENIYRACQIWAVLAYAASKSHIMTYGELGEVIGYPPAGLGPVLLLLQQHCTDNGLPPITALVVSVDTGMPLNWDDATMGDWSSQVQEIFKHTWSQEESYGFVKSVIPAE